MKIFLKGAFCPSLLLAIALVLSVPGCGEDNTSTIAVPQGSALTALPDAYTISGIAADTIVNFTVTATYTDGSAIPYAALDISAPMAEPREAAHYQLCYYPDGVTPVNSSYKAQTDEFGVYRFSIIVYGPDNVFTDTIQVASGSAFVDIDVSSD